MEVIALSQTHCKLEGIHQFGMGQNRQTRRGPNRKRNTHRVSGIAVQAKVYEPHFPKMSLPKIEKQKQRIVSMTQDEFSVYIAGERIEPHHYNHEQQPPTTATKQCRFLATKYYLDNCQTRVCSNTENFKLEKI